VNVQFALETGHFEIHDHDSDDPLPSCRPDPVISNACFVEDFDFDGAPYGATNWPPNIGAGGHSVQISSVLGTGVGPSTSNELYPQIQFETSFRNTLGSTGTMASLIGENVGNNTSFFYPYYTQLKPGLTSSVACELVIGNYATGLNVANNFGQQAQYDGGPVRFPHENAGPIMANPCPSFFAGTPGAANCHGESVSQLAQLYGGMSNAASALGYSSVKDLQDAIRAFCG
jgi:hypothetical protein